MTKLTLIGLMLQVRGTVREWVQENPATVTDHHTIWLDKRDIA